MDTSFINIKKTNQLLYVVNIKLFAKYEKELETQTKALRIYRQDLVMEFDNEKCALLIVESAKRYMMEAIKLPNKDKNQNARRNRNQQILENFWMLWRWKKKLEKECLRSTRKLQETKHQSNKYLGCAHRQILRTMPKMDQERIL